MKNLKLNKILIISLLVVSFGCGTGLQPISTSNSKSNTSSSGTTPSDPWSQIDLTGTIDKPSDPISGAIASPYVNAKLIGLDPVKQTLSLELPLPNGFTGVPMSVQVPTLPGTQVGLMQDSSGRWFIGIEVPLKYLIKGVTANSPNTLPNGDPLPGYPSGEPPTLAFTVHQLNRDFNINIGLNAVSVFVTIPELNNPYVSLVFPIKNKTKRAVIGYIGVIAQKGMYSGGAYAAAIIPPAIARLIDDLNLF